MLFDPSIKDGIEHNISIIGLSLAEALWARMCEGTREDGSIIEPNDPHWEKLNICAKKSKDNPLKWLGQLEIYGDISKGRTDEKYAYQPSSPYAASKAAIIGFSKSIALELGSRNIRSNVIAPGFIETEMTDVLDEKVVQEWRDSIPLKRGGTPFDIANTCVWLGSDMSSYITGQTIHVNGGLLT